MLQDLSQVENVQFKFHRNDIGEGEEAIVNLQLRDAALPEEGKFVHSLVRFEGILEVQYYSDEGRRVGTVTFCILPSTYDEPGVLSKTARIIFRARSWFHFLSFLLTSFPSFRYYRDEGTPCEVQRRFCKTHAYL